MAGQASGDVLQQTVDAFAQKVQEYADGIAGRLGNPLSGTELSKDDAVARWNFTPLGSTMAADAAYHQKVSQGMPPGQALDQVYPMRSQLFSGGASLQDNIATAKQLAGWAADVTGTPAPETPKSSTLPILMAAQRMAQAQQGAAVPQPAVPLPTPPSPVLGAPPVQSAAPMPALPPAPLAGPPPVPSVPAPVLPPPPGAQLQLPLG
jgi:hypothetical protein